MVISVIGGSGFIGSRLVKRLMASGHTVRIVDKNESKAFPGLCVKADVRDLDSLVGALSGSVLVVNLAAEHRDDVSPKTLYDEVNVDGAENVCFACEACGIEAVIFTSSVAVYGFAPVGTDENGDIAYFNDYGRTKWLAEGKYREWLARDPSRRRLTIVRPTVVFGEQNRGNVYNLLNQIAGEKFPMVGKGTNVKSMAYVENIAAFLEYCISNGPGEHLYNYIDKPDFDMNTLVAEVRGMLGKSRRIFHWPYWLGYFGGLCFDLLARVIGKKLPVSSIRVKKFCANTMFEAKNIRALSFRAPVSLVEALRNTINYEFVKKIDGQVFFTE
jgi:GlcNAc-P-P-Und epimerase